MQGIVTEGSRMGIDILLYIECKRSNEKEWRIDPRHYVWPEERHDFAAAHPDDVCCPVKGQIFNLPFCRNSEVLHMLKHTRGRDKLPNNCSTPTKTEFDYYQSCTLRRTWYTLRNLKYQCRQYGYGTVLNSSRSYSSEKSFIDLGISDLLSLTSYLLNLQRCGPMDPWNSFHSLSILHLKENLPLDLIHIVLQYFKPTRRNWQVRCLVLLAN